MRRTFLTSAEFAKHGIKCSRCKRRFRVGERVTVISDSYQVIYRHAGRTCPSSYNPRPL